MTPKHKLLDLPTELLQEIISYLVGTPQVRDPKHVYPSPDPCDWALAPDHQALSFLGRCCHQLRAMIQPRLHGVAGVYQYNHWSEMSLLLSLRDSATFRSQIRYICMDLVEGGMEERMSILAQCSKLESLELCLPTRINSDRAMASEILKLVRSQLRLEHLRTLRLPSHECAINDCPGILEFLFQLVRTFARRSKRLRCLQIVGLEIEVSQYTPVLPSSSHTNLHELVLQDCFFPVSFFPALFSATGANRSLRCLRLDETTAYDAQFAPLDVRQTCAAIPRVIRAGLESVQIIQDDGRKGNLKDLPVPPERPFHALKTLELGSVEILPFCLGAATTLVVSVSPIMEHVELVLLDLRTAFKRGMLKGVERLRFNVVSHRDPEEQELSARAAPGLSRRTWKSLEGVYASYVNVAALHSIPVCTNLQAWMDNKRSLRRIMERMELENEQAVEKEGGGGMLAEDPFLTVSEV